MKKKLVKEEKMSCKYSKQTYENQQLGINTKTYHKAMKKGKWIWGACIVILGYLLVSCNNDTEQEANNEQVLNAGNVNFLLREAPFESITEVDTRSLSVMRDTVDVNGGLEAEVSIESDSSIALPRAETRATEPLKDGTYHIYAFQGGTLKGSLACTMASGKLSSTGYMYLPHGTYDFICVNEQVTYHAATASFKVERADALVAVVQGKLIDQDPKQLVDFELKHLTARVKIKLETYWPITNIKAATQLSPSATQQRATATFTAANPMVVTYGTGEVKDSYTLANATTEAANYTYTTLSNDWQYYFPETDATKFQMMITGGDKLYRRDVAGAKIALKGLSSMIANKSYTIKVRLLYKFQYLFSDGTTGTLAYGNVNGKKAVAAMITTDRAIALTDAGMGAGYMWSPHTTAQQTPHMYTGFTAWYNNTDGYNLTWTPATTLPTPSVKANDPVNYPAFYHAGHYQPLHALTAPTGQLSQWYLPTIGEWKLAFIALGNYDAAKLTDWGGSTSIHWDTPLVKTVFVQAGGTSPLWYSGGGLAGWYWSSSEHSTPSALHVIFYPQDLYGAWWAGNPKTTLMRVRPFIIKKF